MLPPGIEEKEPLPRRAFHMRFDILTLFPSMFNGVFSQSIIGRALEKGLVKILVHDIRDYTHDKHRTVDDYPYGGGTGMVLKPEPLFEAVEDILAKAEQSKEVEAQPSPPPLVVMLSPQGRLFRHQIAQELSTKQHVVLICGHYEGVDERVREHLVQDEISIGDYVLSGGELPAMVMVDAIVRLLPGALGGENAAAEDSHAMGLLEYPQYTRPPLFRGWGVPPVLLSGNHGEIARWRRHQALLRTLERRPELLDRVVLSPEEKQLIEEERFGQSANPRKEESEKWQT